MTISIRVKPEFDLEMTGYDIAQLGGVDFYSDQAKRVGSGTGGVLDRGSHCGVRIGERTQAHAFKRDIGVGIRVFDGVFELKDILHALIVEPTGSFDAFNARGSCQKIGGGQHGLFGFQSKGIGHGDGNHRKNAEQQNGDNAFNQRKAADLGMRATEHSGHTRLR